MIEVAFEMFAELADDLDSRANQCHKMADEYWSHCDGEEYTRFTGKASAYQHAAQMIRDTLQRIENYEE